MPNISAKHEGGDPEVEAGREHPSDIFDYFVPQERSSDAAHAGAPSNYLDKHAAVNRTAAELTPPASPCRRRRAARPRESPPHRG